MLKCVSAKHFERSDHSFMNLIEALILGMVQGLTEFLPISSTAHIVIASMLLDLDFPGLTMEIFLHIASVFAVMLYFYKDLWKVIVGFFSYFKNKTDENKVQFRFGLYIIVATMITGLLGILLKDFVGDNMKTPIFISIALIVTGLLLIFIERVHQIGNKTEAEMTWLDAVIVALGQTLAVLPGISRSGSTLVAALWTGLDRDTAVRFSFLLVIPVILGSTVLMVGDADFSLVQDIGWGALFVSFFASFIFSIIGIIWLIDFLKKSKLIYFAIYCFIVAIFVLIYFESGAVIDLD